MSKPVEIVLGIDPGTTGALALVELRSRNLVSCHDFPLMNLGNAKRIVDPVKFAELLRIYQNQKNAIAIKFAVIEDVGVMTGKEGVVSMFNFGKGAGMLVGVLAGLSIPTFHVRPAIWKTDMNVPKDKKKAMEKAVSIFSYNEYMTRVKDHGRAEAAMLAFFGIKKFGNVW